MGGSSPRGSAGLARVAATALAHPPMRRLQIASVAWSAGEAAYLVGLFVYAYGIGGPASVATVAVLRTVPSVFLAPVTTVLTHGATGESLLRGTLLVRFISVSLTGAVLLGEAPDALVYLLVAVDAVAATLLRPIRGSLLPTIARSPAELVAGNVALTTGDSLANLMGPGLAAAALIGGGPIATFVPGVALLGLALVTGAGVHGATSTTPTHASTARGRTAGRPPWSAGRPAFPVIGAFTVQRFVRGALTVLLVAAAIDQLRMGDAGVGLLTFAIGFGGLVGGVAAVGLIGQRHLAPWFVLGIALWCVPFVLIGTVPLAAVAVLFLAIGGVGKVLIDIAGYSLLQRAVPNDSRTRVLGMQEGLVTGALALGAVAAAAIVETFGIGVALIAAGALPLLVISGLWPSLQRVDARAHGHDAELVLLDRVPLFRPLQLAVKAELAAQLDHLVVEPGEVVVREGAVGDRYYIIESGTVEVEIEGEPGRRMTDGEAFGEIALLRDVPRTATVRAITQVRLAALDRRGFLAAVTGHRESAILAEQVVSERLGG